MSKTIAINTNGMIYGHRTATMQRDENHRKPNTHPKGRRCKTCKCDLSIYNGSRYCSIHERYDARAEAEGSR